MEVAIILLVLAGLIVASVHDLKTRQVPNEISLPLLFIAISSRVLLLLLGRSGMTFSALLIYVLFTGVIFAVWMVTPMGGGDAKLWMALVWLTPPAALDRAPLVWGLIYGGTALGQALVRFVLRRPIFGVPLPSAWRTLLYGLWLLVLAVPYIG